MSDHLQPPERHRGRNGDTVPVLSLETLAGDAGVGVDDDVTIDDVFEPTGRDEVFRVDGYSSREAWRIANIPKRVRWVTESFEDRQLLGRGSPCWTCGAPRDLATYVADVDAEQAYGAPWTTWRVLTSCSRCFARTAGRTLIDGRCLIHGTDGIYNDGRQAQCRTCVTMRKRASRERQRELLKRSHSYAVGNDAGSASGSASAISEAVAS